MDLFFRSPWLPLLPAACLAAMLVTGCHNPSAMNESTPNVKHVTQANFSEEVTQYEQPVVVDFYATWCAPCQQLSPILDRLAGNHAGAIKFVKVNVDESPGLAQNFDAQILPMVLLFKHGKLVDRIVGLPEEADLKAKLDAFAGAK